MTPQQFIAKWQAATLNEKKGYQQHFLDLCELLGQPKPAEADPDGAWYTFEKGVRTTTDGQGFADVWMQGKFAWEYKGKRKDLKAAYQQLLKYREDLHNPPLLVVCDLDRFEIHTNFTGTTKRVYAFDLDGLAEPQNLDVLRKLFTDPEALRPGQTAQKLTEQVAAQFGQLADGIRQRGVAANDAAHFLMKLIFCLFAEDIELLPDKLFKRILTASKKDPAKLTKSLKELFAAMSTGGDFWGEDILYFNGGLFADSHVLDLLPLEIGLLQSVAERDWSSIEPSIFGTLFERTLDPDKRSQIGAHYTSREDIETLLNPVMIAPLRREWDAVRQQCEDLWPQIVEGARGKSAKPAALKKTRAKFDRLLLDYDERLAHVTVLDPACGSGNFLYVALHRLLGLEKEVIAYAAKHGVSLLPKVLPTQLAGLEINPYAAELAQVAIWIGYLQWMRDNGFSPPSHPVLEPITSIRRQDAILDLSDPRNPREPEWPEAEFIVGNPPFLGGRKLRRGLGASYLDGLFSVYSDRVKHTADLCCYWFEKAAALHAKGMCNRIGLLATQSIRGKESRFTIDRAMQHSRIFFAISDQDWVLDGTMVHVSFIAFDRGEEQELTLDGRRVPTITSSLSCSADVGVAQRLPANEAIAFQGITPMGPFDIGEELAVRLLGMPTNVNARPNSDVVRQWANGKDMLDRKLDQWIIDFGSQMTEACASKYEAPFEYVRDVVLTARKSGNTQQAIATYWRHWRPRQEMRDEISILSDYRYAATPRVGKHRVILWVSVDYLPSDATVAFAISDDYQFGLIQSRVHETWARAPGNGTQVRERESGFRYTPTTCFETFPFPEPTDAQRDAIAAAAKELDRLRTNWLNPPELVRTEVLEFPGTVGGPWSRYIDPATVFTPSPGASLGEGRGEGTLGFRSSSDGAEKAERHPHPNPLPPKRRERGQGGEAPRSPDRGDNVPLRAPIAFDAHAHDSTSHERSSPPSGDGGLNGRESNDTPRIGTVKYPRLVPKNEEAAKELKKRTLTNLYNQRPTWLDHAHQKLDAAVFAAYGWEPTLSDDELLAKLLALNLERSG